MAVPSNGPGIGPTDGPPPWESPLSTDDMRQKCDNWTLAGDAGLLNFLQQFSQRMISKTHDMEQLLNSLDHETKVTGTRVSNVINDFHMLSNTQFVESRVYDEAIQDESPKGNKKPEETKSKEERETELVAKVLTALNLGLTTLDHAFDRVELQQDSDSEEEEDSIMKGGTILEARDPYLNRPIPLLIGTPGFLSDDYVGLQDVLSEEEVTPEKEDLDSEATTESESEPELAELTKPKSKDLSDSESRGSDLFHSGAEDGEYLSRSSSFSTGSEAEKVVNVDQTDKSNAGPPKDALGPGLLADELENRLKKYGDKPQRTRVESRLKSDTASIHSRSSRMSSSSRHTKKATPVKKAPSEEDLFGRVEDVNDEDEALFGRRNGLFSAGGKLFDNEENSLFDDVKQDEPVAEEKLITPQTRGRTKSGKKIPSGAIPVLTDGGLFKSPKSQKPGSDNLDSEKVPEPQKEEPKVSPNPPKPTPKSSGGGLFDDSGDDDDDLFGFSSKPKATPKATPPAAAPAPAPTKKNTVPSKKTSSAAPVDDLFASDDEGSDLFGAETAIKEIKKDTKKRPPGSVPIFGRLSSEIASTLKQRKDEDSDNSSDSSPGSSGGMSSKSRSSLPGNTGPLAGTAVATPKASQGTKPSRSNSVSSNSLFLEDPETDDLFTNITSRRDSKPSSKEPKKSFLFDSDSYEDALFSSQPSAPSKPQPAKAVTSSRIASDLFDDMDEDDGLFAAIAKPTSSSKKPSAGLNLSEDKKVVAQPPPEAVKPEPKVKAASVAEKKVSLFDEDVEDEDLFSSRPTNKSRGSLTSESREEIVQTPSSPVANSKQAAGTDELDAAKVKPEEDIRKTRTTSLFDDDDLLFGGPPSESPDVDLFTTRKTEPPKEPQAPVPKASPVGGVALFGGINPFAGAKNNKASPTISEISDVLQSQNSASPTVPVVEEPKKRPPMLKDTKDISVSFDDPVDTSNTLQNAAKDRAKVQVKRRPPSRKGRQAAARNSGVDFLIDIPESTTVHSQPEAEIKTPPVPSLTDSPVAKSQAWKTENAEEFRGSTKPVKSEPFLSVTKDLDLQSPSTEEEDLFSVGEPKKDTRLFMTNNGTGNEQNALKSKGSKTGLQDSNRTKKNRDTSSKTVDIFASDDDEDDIFSGPPIRKSVLEETRNTEKNENASSNVDDLFGIGNEEDIFASVPSKRQEKTTPNNNQTVRSIFDDDDDDGDSDDIFAPRPGPKTSQGNMTKTTVRKPLKNSSSVDAFTDPLSQQKDEPSK